MLHLLQYSRSTFPAALLLSGLVHISAAQSQPPTQSTAPSNRVFFIQPADAAKISSPFVVKFGVEGKKIGPLGDMSTELGHHHLIIDKGPVENGKFVPFDSQHMHFGQGQTETTLNLAPGDYALTLQFGNGVHQSYGTGMSQTIRVQVLENQKPSAALALPASAW
jgi:Domain of unknown function (DUF4399)